MCAGKTPHRKNLDTTLSTITPTWYFCSVLSMWVCILVAQRMHISKDVKTVADFTCTVP